MAASAVGSRRCRAPPCTGPPRPRRRPPPRRYRPRWSTGGCAAGAPDRAYRRSSASTRHSASASARWTRSASTWVTRSKSSPTRATTGLTVDVPGVEPVQELRALDRPEHQLPLAVEPLSAERVLGDRRRARVHGGRGLVYPAQGHVRRRRLALWVWYRGDRFQGWQSQRTGRSVQETLVAAALATHGVSGAPCRGSHRPRRPRRCQPVSLRVPRPLAPRRSPTSAARVGRRRGRDAPDGFHAQWSSAWKEYRYRLATGPRSRRVEGLVWETATHPRLEGRMVDPARVRWALQRAVGTRDCGLHARSSVRRPRTLSASGGGSRTAWWRWRCAGTRSGATACACLVGGAVLVAAGLAAEGTWSARSRVPPRSRGFVRPRRASRSGSGLRRAARPVRRRHSADSECRRSCLWIRPGAARRRASSERCAWPARRRSPRAGTRSGGCGCCARRDFRASSRSRVSRNTTEVRRGVGWEMVIP